MKSRPGQTDIFASALGNGPLSATCIFHPLTHSPDPSLVKCLSTANNTDGAAVVLGDCTSANAQWTVPNGAKNAGTLQIFGNKVCFSLPHRDTTKVDIFGIVPRRYKWRHHQREQAPDLDLCHRKY
jgi:hypothetical protein